LTALLHAPAKDAAIREGKILEFNIKPASFFIKKNE
jgi:hypothetical protein